MPSSFDLRNISGFDFTNGVRDQGGCGSCYTFSFIEVIESRLKVKYGKRVPLLSPQQLLSCNYMAEGCEGGWAIMHGFFAENAGITTEECAPYQFLKKQACSKLSHCKSVARVTQSYKLKDSNELAI